MGGDVTVLRVFTDAAGNFGNPLGIVDAASVPASQRQAIASELGYSETIFVGLPSNGSTTAHARIFTPATELPFAGHHMVGAAWWLRTTHREVPTSRCARSASISRSKSSAEENDRYTEANRR